MATVPRYRGKQTNRPTNQEEGPSLIQQIVDKVAAGWQAGQDTGVIPTQGAPATPGAPWYQDSQNETPRSTQPAPAPTAGPRQVVVGRAPIDRTSQPGWEAMSPPITAAQRDQWAAQGLSQYPSARFPRKPLVVSPEKRGEYAGFRDYKKFTERR